MPEPLPRVIFTEPEKPNRLYPILGILVFILLCGLALYGLMSSSEEETDLSEIKMISVQKRDFIEEIYGTGSAESSQNTRIINQVMGASTITELIPEGEYVREGDVLLRLDTKSIDESLTSYKSNLINYEARVIKAQAKVVSNEISLEKYIEGTFETELLNIDKNIYTYTEKLKQDIENLEHSEDLLRNGFTTPSQVEVDRVGCRKDLNNLDSYHLRRKILLKYTSEKEIISYLSAIESSRSNVLNNAYIREIFRGLTDRFQKQLDFCTVRAPHDGRVAYANQVRRRWRRQSDIIREGGTVYLWQELLLLPDPNFMQIRAKINETNAIVVRPGMKAKMTFSALPGRLFHGSVASISPFPDIGWMTSVKNYITLISIEDPVPEIRTGLTAECTITVGVIKDALVVPRRSVVESGGKLFCLVRNKKTLVPKEILLGPCNEDDVVVLKGISEKESVVETAVSVKSRVQFPLPELPSIYPEYNDPVLTTPSVPTRINQEEAIEDNNSPYKEVGSGKSIARYDDIKAAIKAERQAFEEKKMAELKDHYEKTKNLQKYFSLSFMELCDKFDTNGDKRISMDEMKKNAPEINPFFKEWDRNEDGILSRTEFVLGFYSTKTLFEKGLALAEAELLKTGSEVEKMIEQETMNQSL